MRLITLHTPPTKTVNYFGLELTVPTNVRYLAMDSGGAVFGYTTPPRHTEGLDIWRGNGTELIATVEVDRDWKTTLVELS